MNHSNTKHIALCHFFVRERIAFRDVAFAWISASEDIADLFTKALGTQRTSNLPRGLDLSLLAYGERRGVHGAAGVEGVSGRKKAGEELLAVGNRWIPRLFSTFQ